MFIFSFEWSEFVLGGSYTVISSEKMLSFHVCSAIERSFINNQRLMKVLNKRYLNYLAYKQGHNMNSGNVYSVNAVFFSSQ